MGKYRTCANNAKSGEIVHRCVNLSTSHPQNGNGGGRIKGNPVNHLSPSSTLPSRHKKCQTPFQQATNPDRFSHHRPNLAFFCILGLFISSYLVTHAQAEPALQGQGQGQPPQNGADNEAGLDPSSLAGFVDPLPNCSRPSAEDFPPDLFSPEARRSGAIILHFLVTVYLFYALLLVCDEYFVPAVESICRELRIPSDVAGATFMAISTSAPELFTNVIGTFQMSNGDMGVGTIVGSAVFNILAVGACCGIGAGVKLVTSSEKVGVRLDWWPLTRDSLFYLVSVGALIGILANRRVYWTEALLMLALYACYVLVLCFNTPIRNVVEGLGWKIRVWWGGQPRHISIVVGKILHLKDNERTPLLRSVHEKGPDNNNESLSQSQRVKSDAGGLDFVLSREYDINDMPLDASLDEVLIHNALSCSGSFASQPIEECSNCCCGWPYLSHSSPQNLEGWDRIRRWTEWVISWPIRFFLWLTIPDCRVPRLRHWYWGTLAMCVAWIGILTYIISWMVTIIGDTLSIPDSVTGLTFLAAGTSIPEVISSLIVARQGLGSMGFSNTIGSNTFDVLVCLGLPWLIKAALLSGTEGGVDYIQIHSGGLEYSAVILISALLLLYTAIACNGFILDRKIGVGCVLVYFIFICFACMLEMNVFFPVNLPPC